MTPNFALSLSLEGLRLLHRAPAGWTRIGEVPLDSADLAGDLARLRAAALVRAPEGLRTKLLIPNDQIRYLVLDGVHGADAVATALEGTTPYAVDELAIDYVIENGRTHVAAVARETLEEAEGFAREHALEPVAFAAVPEPDGFPGEVMFGPVDGLEETVARDEVAVRELPPEAQSAPAENTPAVASEADAAPIETSEPGMVEVDAPPAPLPAQPPTEAAEAGTGPDTDASDRDMAAIDAPVSDADALDDTAAPVPPPQMAVSETFDADKPRDQGETGPTPHSDVPETEDEALLAPATSAAPSAPEQLPQADAPVVPDLPLPGETRIDEDEAMLAEPQPAFVHREPPRPAAPPAAPPLPPRGEGARDKATTPHTNECADAARRIMPPAMPRPGAPPAAMPAMPPARPAEGPSAEENAETAALAAGAALVAPEAEASRPANTPRAEPGGSRSADLASERERMTVFGARRATPEKRPRRLALIAGVVVTALLVILFGLWVNAAEEDPQAGLLRDTSADPATSASDEASGTPAAEPEVELAAAVPQDVAPEPLPDYDDYPAPERGPAAAVSPAEAERIYAATGVWLRAPRLPLTPRAEQLGQPVAVASEPVAETGTGGLRLTAASPDGGLPLQTVPPPAGSVFARDARGFIAATAEGTVTPQGLVIYEGRPEILPPTRPGTVAPPAPSSEKPGAEETEIDEGRDDDTAALVDPGSSPEGLVLVPGQPPVVPPTRPGTAPADTSEVESDEVTPGGVALDALRPTQRPEDAVLPPLAVYEGPRPALRPEGLAPDAESQVTEAADAQATALAEVVGETPNPPARASVADALASLMADAPDPLANATPQAVPTARRPDPRPRNFDRVVAQSRNRAPAAAAPAAAASAPQQVATATVAPDGPVPGSVASAATRDNAINLRDINLIGVYGKPGARRALIRMDNGRYLRVGIGDALDGGKVTAIGDDVLNYVRRGRTMVLQIPD